MVVDYVDVDSQKWLDYGHTRTPGFLYSAEGRRCRVLENQCGRLAKASFLSTTNEQAVFAAAHPGIDTCCVQNGVDFEYFDPSNQPEVAEVAGRDYIVFVGVMNYFPNSSGVRAFATDVFPALKRKWPGLEFFIVGRDPSAGIKKLGAMPGITVTGSVPDVRPYLQSARAVVAPLSIARGIQNKVLEALAMGKRLLASPAVCQTFGAELPEGIESCETDEQYVSAIGRDGSLSGDRIRFAAQRRFSWHSQMDFFCAKVEQSLGGNGVHG
jgi:glycosyltransferase involved in cell wall biosynthesis